MSEQRKLGQYFTTNNPFKTDGFLEWLDLIPNLKEEVLLEPFAGSNNIPYMIINDNGLMNNWSCYDIDPDENNKCPNFIINERDCLKDFPEGHNVIITNPPYLSKNSATRRGLEFPDTKYDDLYKLCLEKMLNNCNYVAAIIPETFITSGLFHSRLFAVISLTCKMFDNTECPVCLALFIPEHNNSFKVYQMNNFIGQYNELKKFEISTDKKNKWKFNDPNGEIGIWCIDDTKNPSIHFGRGEDIPSSKIKVSSRSLTRVSGVPNDIDLNELTKESNELLKSYREKTKDVFLASFKGLRNDGFYRRRLDFATARSILDQALINLKNKK